MVDGGHCHSQGLGAMRRRDEGFTLVEVLVAFAIMAGAIIMAFNIFGDGLRGLKSAQVRSHQIQVAQHQIDLAATAISLSEGTMLITDENVKLRVEVQALPDFKGGLKFIQKPFRIGVFLDDPKSTAAPILETIIITKPIRP